MDEDHIIINARVCCCSCSLFVVQRTFQRKFGERYVVIIVFRYIMTNNEDRASSKTKKESPTRYYPFELEL